MGLQYSYEIKDLWRGKELQSGKWMRCKSVIHAYRPERVWFFLEDECITSPQKLKQPKGVMFEIDKETLTLCSGYCDILGKLIFAGDIVRVTYTGTCKGLEGVAMVVFDNGVFGLLWGWHRDLIPFTGFANVEMRVIGNIFDNPELLKEEQ